MQILQPESFKHYIDYFSSMEPEGVVNLIPNAQAWDWISCNVPLFSCPDRAMEEMYYFRWWTFRKHIKQTPAGRIITEFIEPVKHAGSYNSISCALGHQIAEGRWLRDQSLLDEYIRFWFRSDNGKPEPKFHKYSQWTAAAIWDRYLVTGDASLVRDLLPDLFADYETWEREKLRDDGLFWQFDVWDGMEESISGSRKHKNARPTINSYMYANACAIANFAELADRPDLVETYRAKAVSLRKLVHEKLWDPQARFFKAQSEEGPLSDAREEIGFIPWCFNLPEAGHEDAWAQLADPLGFWAPFGITTAERRHPRFRSHGVGHCEWDGAVWPFATSQTLNALSNVLRNYNQSHVTRQHFFDAMQTFVKSQRMNGKPYIGEYLDETTGEWLKGDNPRSRYYNHSTFCDHIITGIAGLIPGGSDVDPLIPERTWDWFCLDGVPYHGHNLAIVWDRDGSKFGGHAGLRVLVDGQVIADSPRLTRINGKLPT